MFPTLLSDPFRLLLFAVSILTAITIHEFAHAYVADYLGDPTARLKGRLSLNPLVHLDLYGLLFLLLIGFGWGKPVTFDPYNLKNPRKDASLISLAGPASNFILAIVLALLLKVFIFIKLYFLFTIGAQILYWNLVLGIFNLLPVGPLDGFKIVGGFLSEEKAREWYSLEKYGMIFLLLLVIPIGRTSLVSTIISPVISFLLNILIPQSGAGVI